MATLMVDSDVYSYLQKNNPAHASPYRPHLQGHTIALSFITVGEQYAGCLRKIMRNEWPRSRLQGLEALLLSVVIVPYDIEICKVFGELRTLKNQDGSDRTIDTNDLWIAACAKRYSLTLVTNNRRHFENIPGLNIICEAPRTRATKKRN
jgi:predicted nucleic acid-binding protein